MEIFEGTINIDFDSNTGYCLLGSAALFFPKTQRYERSGLTFEQLLETIKYIFNSRKCLLTNYSVYFGDSAKQQLNEYKLEHLEQIIFDQNRLVLCCKI